MQPGTVERCLLLLGELLAACLPLAASAPQQPLQQWLAAAAIEAADELGSYASMAAAALQQPEQPQKQQQPGSRTAQLALGCAASSLRLLMAAPADEHAPSRQPAVERLSACCVATLQAFAAAAQGLQQAAAAATAADAAVWQQVAAWQAPVAECSSALAVAVESSWLQGREGEEELSQAAAAATAALAAVLALQATAAAAAPAGAPSQKRGGASSGGSLPVYCHRQCWKAAASLLALQQGLNAPQPHAGWEEQQAGVLAAALNSLQHAGAVAALAADHRSLLLQLRCCRLLRPAAAQQPRIAQLALAQRQQAQPAAAPADCTAGSQQLALAGWLCDAAWDAYEGATAAFKRRRAGLTAAVVSTCLHPTLFGAGTAALHAPGSRLQRLVGELCGLGTKSWRTMSIVALQVRLGRW